jgi:hypothetical protein
MTKVVRRKARGMRVHYGLVASRHQVMNDAVLREEINKNLEGHVLCVDTEATGLMNDFTCTFIRGIRDYDPHRDKAWQEHAAAIGAAFAKELLQYAQSSDISGERPVKEILNHS